MHGGQAIPAFDFMLAPYVRATWKEEVKIAADVTCTKLDQYYDLAIEDFENEIRTEDLSKDEQVSLDVFMDTMTLNHARKRTIERVHQAMESFVHNMNTIHSRGGNQVVFSSINYGTDTSAEGRLITREILKSTYDGVGNGETAIFPIQIYKLKSGINVKPGDPNYDLYQLACKVTAKRFFPNFLNLDVDFNTHPKWDVNDPNRWMYEPATMGCRTRVFSDRHGEDTSVARGNLSFSTINLVRLALEANGNLDEFFASLDKYCDIGIRQLYDRYRFQCTATAKQFPLLMSGLWKGSEGLAPDDSVEPVLKHGTLSLGFIGLAEALVVLTGKHHGESEVAQEIGLQIVRFMRQKCDKAAEEYDLNYSLLATPAEGLSGKFVKKDRRDFGVIPNVTDRDFYTNSAHVPVWHQISIADKMRIEAPYHKECNAGHIAYVELDGNLENNVEAVQSVVDAMLEYGVGYGSINHVRNRCLQCGNEDSATRWDICPECGSEDIDVIERITGYLVGSVGRWNAGKKAELEARVSHVSGQNMMAKA